MINDIYNKGRWEGGDVDLVTKNIMPLSRYASFTILHET